MNGSLEELSDQMYEKLKHQNKITQILVMRHAGVDFDTADKICQKIWKRLRKEAREMANEVYAK